MKFTTALAASALFAAPVFADLVVKHTVDGYVVKSEVTNTGDDAVTVVDHPQSVVSTDLKTDVFSFESEDGKAPAFTGVAVKWDSSSAQPVVIGAGETKTFEQDISDSYDFSKSGESTYTVLGGDKFYSISDDGSVVPVDTTVVPTSAKISGSQVARKRGYAPVYGSLGKRTTYPGCSTSQIATISQAATKAQEYIQSTLAYNGQVTSVNVTPRWKEWFGDYTPARGAKISDHFSRMVNDPTTDGKISYDCGTCTRSGVYAYVYPDQPYKIYLCSVFWNAPLTGTDSKAGTIVHELSHFNDNGGTRDYAYGHANAHALALSNPDTAVMNADSHEYYAENTPFLN